MVSIKSPTRLELWLPADTKSVPDARHETMQACTQAGLTDEDCFALDLALGEALSNAVVHGSPLGSDPLLERKIQLSLWAFHECLIIHIQDPGQSFEPPAPPYPMPPAWQEETHGRGLPLMEMLTDAMIVCRGGADVGGASVFLVKNMTHLC